MSTYELGPLYRVAVLIHFIEKTAFQARQSSEDLDFKVGYLKKQETVTDERAYLNQNI